MRRDDRYAKEFLAGWGSMDFNGHMANWAYLNVAADVRMAFFAEHGFPPREFRRLALGPVMRKDKLEYFREVGLHETVTVTYAVLAMSPDGARFVVENEIWSVVELLACGYHHIADFEEPTAVTRMELRNANNGLLWRIDSSKPKRLGVVDYGIVPEGYVQAFPANVPPRPLRDGEPLLLVYTTADSWTRHEGTAVGVAAFRGGFWHSGPLARTSPDKVFVETPMPISELFRK